MQKMLFEIAVAEELNDENPVTVETMEDSPFDVLLRQGDDEIVLDIDAVERLFRAMSMILIESRHVLADGTPTSVVTH